MGNQTITIVPKIHTSIPGSCCSATKAGSFVGRIVIVIKSGAYYFADVMGRIFPSKDNFEKLLKIISGALLALQIHFGSAASAVVDTARNHFVVTIDIFAGFNIFTRIHDFTTGYESNRKKGSLKILNRSILVVTNICESLITLKNFGLGPKLAQAASAMGRWPVFNVLAKAGLSTVKNWTAFGASVVAIVACGLQIVNAKEIESREDTWPAILGLANDMGKTFLIVGVTSGLGLPALIIATNLAGLIKNLYAEYNKKPTISLKPNTNQLTVAPAA